MPTVELPPATPSTAHVTVLEPLTVAVNCCVWVVVTTAAWVGLTLTLPTLPMPLELAPPHPARRSVARRHGNNIAYDLLRIWNPPMVRGDNLGADEFFHRAFVDDGHAQFLCLIELGACFFACYHVVGFFADGAGYFASGVFD